MEQDWTPVTIHAKKQQKQQKSVIQSKPGAGKNNNSTNDYNMRKIDETEIGSINHASLSLSNKIKDGRNAKNLTQEQLNTLCSFPKNTVSKYENGKATVNQTELNKMSKILGVKITK